MVVFFCVSLRFSLSVSLTFHSLLYFSLLFIQWIPMLLHKNCGQMDGVVVVFRRQPSHTMSKKKAKKKKTQHYNT